MHKWNAYRLSEVNWDLFLEDLDPDRVTFYDAIKFGAQMYQLGRIAEREERTHEEDQRTENH